MQAVRRVLPERSGAALCHTPLNGASHRIGAILYNTPLNGAPLYNTPLNGAPLNGAPLNGAQLYNTPLNGAPHFCRWTNGSGAYLRQALERAAEEAERRAERDAERADAERRRDAERAGDSFVPQARRGPATRRARDPRSRKAQVCKSGIPGCSIFDTQVLYTH